MGHHLVAFIGREFCYPEVGKIRLSRRIYEYVVGLDIAVNHAGGMCRTESRSDIYRHLNGRLDLERAILADKLAETLAVDIVHYDVA